MPKLLRATLLLLLLTMVSIPAMAQEESDTAVVRIIPNEAAVGTQHIILITGLEASEQVTVRLISEDNDANVYESLQIANERGIVEIEIFTEMGDQPGDYRVEVLNESEDVIGTAPLTVLEAITFNPEVHITPLEAEVGATFTIEVTDIRPFAVLEVFIESEDGVEVFSQRLRATVDGTAIIEFESDVSATGILSVRVIEDETTEIASTEINILGQVFPTTIVIEPAEALPGDTVFVTISGLEANASVVIDIALGDEILATIEETANISGLVIFTYTFANDVELGRYQFRLFQDGEQIGLETLRLDIPPVIVNITPPVGTVGSVFVVTVNDLRADEEITVEFSLDDEIIQTRTTHADAEGIARTTLGQRVDLELGIYTVRVFRLGEQVFSQTVEVAEVRPASGTGINPDDISISASPESGIIPTAYTITVEGLPADTNLTLFVLFDGQSILSLSGTADADGLYSTQITSEASDPSGIYTIEVRAEGTVIGSVDIEILDESSESDEGEETAPPLSGDVNLSINPAILPQGERIEFIITNLVPDETVTFELLFEGDVIYSTESTANAEGAAGVALVARDDDPIGNYEVRILRDDEIIATNSFELVNSNAEIDNASVRIEPESAAQGSDYAIIVTGLAPNETVEVIVSLDSDIIFETEREANENGTFTVVLNSDSSDEIGTYQVTILREDGNDLEASLTITEGSRDVSTTDDEDTIDQAVEISIDPDEGELGTEHEIIVTGLSPNETFNLIIEFDSEVVYSVEHSADEEGNFVTTISTSDSDPFGDYEIIIEREDAEDISAILTVVGDEDSIDSQTNSELEIRIEPNEVAAQEPFDLIVTGLAAEETVIIEIEYDGEILFETESAANADGEIVLRLATDEGDPTGIYTINVRRNDEVLSVDVLVLDDTASENTLVEIALDPTSATIGSEYEFIISGLGSNEEFEIVVAYDGEIVFETTRTADASGFYSIKLETSDSDELGIYNFSVLRDGDILASIEFEVEAALVEDDTADEVGTDSEGDVATLDDSDEDSDVEGDAEDSNDEADSDVLETDIEATPVTYADAVSVEFDADNPVQVVEFEGQAGDVIAVTVDSGDTIDTVATLISPSGEEIASDDDGGLGFDPEIERAVLPDTGTYTLEIRTFTLGDAGTAVVTISRNDVRTLDDDETRTIHLNSKITTDILTFEGQAGEVISLIIELDSGEIGALSISAEQNDALLMNYQTFGLPQTIVLGFVVPENGNVIIRIEDDGTGNAVLNASIQSE